MTKKRLEVSIEEEILQKAKKHIPNLSNFFEECLIHYLGYADGNFRAGNAKDIIDKIGKLQVELFLINENYDAEESQKRVKLEEKNNAWRFLWNDYRINLRMDNRLLDNY